MKKSFKIVFNILLLGWMPFMFLSVWGSWNRTIGIIVLCIGAFTCLIGSLSFIAVLNNSNFWKTQKELEEAIKRNNEEADKYIDSRYKLIRAALKFEEDKS